MAVTAQDVKALREATGAGMMDCKRALQENDGDFDKAVGWLREKGMASAAKRADRAAAEGAVMAKVLDDARTAGMLELNCETDFVARGDEFQTLAEGLLDQVIAEAPDYVSSEEAPAGASGKFLVDLPYIHEASKTVADVVTALSGKTGEKMEVRRFVRFEIPADAKGMLFSYVHMGGKIGVLAEIHVDNDAALKDPAFDALGRDLSLQICSASPRWVSSDQVAQSAIDEEMRIYKAQAAETGKPENICEKIAQGKLRKWYEEVCLVQQTFVKDNEKTITQLLEETGKALGAMISIARFARFERGEGIEKAQADLADDVAKAIADAEGK